MIFKYYFSKTQFSGNKIIVRWQCETNWFKSFRLDPSWMMKNPKKFCKKPSERRHFSFWRKEGQRPISVLCPKPWKISPSSEVIGAVWEICRCSWPASNSWLILITLRRSTKGQTEAKSPILFTSTTDAGQDLSAQKEIVPGFFRNFFPEFVISRLMNTKWLRT